MDRSVEEQLLKQLKILNFWVRFFGVIVMVCLIIVGYLLFRVAWFIKETNDKFNDFQQTTSQKLDVKQQVCSGEGSFSDFIRNSTEACQ